jgi:hypothetical protein
LVSGDTLGLHLDLQGPRATLLLTLNGTLRNVDGERLVQLQDRELHRVARARAQQPDEHGGKDGGHDSKDAAHAEAPCITGAVVISTPAVRQER